MSLAALTLDGCAVHPVNRSGAPGRPPSEERATEDARRVYAAYERPVRILRLPTRALHIELPRRARADWGPLYTDILADFVLQAAALPAPR